MSASVVEYEGFLSSGAATLTPGLRYDRPGVSLGISGSWTVFESGNQIVQGTAAAAKLARLSEHLRLEYSASAGASRYASAPATGHLLTRGRLHAAGVNRGLWIGATTGALFEDAEGVPVELALGAWSVHNRFALVGTVTQTWLGDNRHVDLMAAARWTGERLEVEARMGARPWTVSEGDIGDAITTTHGELSALVTVHQRIALALSAGSYPADPVRRVLSANYATAGLRFTLAGADAPTPPLIALNTRAPVRDPTAAKDGAPVSIEISSAGSEHTVRIYAANASSVELMGDFTDWQTLPLKKTGPAEWEAKLRITQGVHRLNVRIDGGEWIVPEGARHEPGEFGPPVGVIFVR